MLLESFLSHFSSRNTTTFWFPKPWLYLTAPHSTGPKSRTSMLTRDVPVPSVGQLAPVHRVKARVMWSAASS